MFKKKYPNRIKSDEGFEIARTDRFDLEYKETDRKMIVKVEDGRDKLVVYSASIKEWLPPDNEQTISNEDKMKIIQNNQAAIDFASWKYVIE